MAITLVQTVTVTASGGVTSIVFDNIPQTGKDLLMLFSLRDRISGEDTGQILMNNAPNLNFQFRWLKGTGSGVASSADTQNYLDSAIVPNTFTANTFSNMQIYIPNYAGSASKTFSWDTVTENNATTGLSVIGAHRWNSVDAITKITYSQFTTNAIAQYSTASLYIVS